MEADECREEDTNSDENENYENHTASDLGLSPPNPPDALPPGHPLLQRAQEALFQQLSEAKQRLQEELRSKKKNLKESKAEREQLGVDLYGFQHHLARLQLVLDSNTENLLNISQQRSEADDNLRQLRKQVDREKALSELQRSEVEKLQQESDRLTEALKHIERYNEGVSIDISLTERLASAAESQLQKSEKKKQDQDFVIQSMQEKLKRLTRQSELHTSHLEAQRRETRAAQEFLGKAVLDMQDVQFEKKMLVSQWKSSLIAMKRRDEALEMLQEAVHQQEEQLLTYECEMRRSKKDIQRRQQANEHNTALLKRLGEQTSKLSHLIESIKKKQCTLQSELEVMQEQHSRIKENIQNACDEGSRLATQKQDLVRQYEKLKRSIQGLEQQVLDKLAEESSTEKHAQRIVQDTRALRDAMQRREQQMQSLQTQIGQLQGELNTSQVRNSQLSDALQQLEQMIKEKDRHASTLKSEMSRCESEIDQKTHDLDALNRKLSKITENVQDPDTGPLEASISNLKIEIRAKTCKGRELQQRWMTIQGQLVAVQSTHAEAAESIQLMHAERAVLQRKKQRLEQQLHNQHAEIHALQKTLNSLHKETARLNSLLADTTGWQATLDEDNFLLETQITNDLKEMEGQWASMQSSIKALRAEKKELLASVLKYEKDVLLMERKIQLEREMKEAIDPSYGNEEVAALHKDVSRLRHRFEDLMREQERMVLEMERAVSKRDIIAMKGRASQSQKVQDVTLGQLKKSAADMAKCISQAEKEVRLIEQRSSSFDDEMKRLEQDILEAGNNCNKLVARQHALRAELEMLGIEKYKSLVATQTKQKEAQRYQQCLSGSYKSLVSDPSRLPEELAKAEKKQKRVTSLLQRMVHNGGELQNQLERVLVHAIAA